MITLTNRQARQFLLLKQGLLGEHKFTGKEGILDYVRQAGCIQFDPVDVCGKNAELVCQSRIKGFTKAMLYDLLYRERTLVDYIDKNVAITLTEEWPHFKRYRDLAKANGRRFDGMAELEQQAKAYIMAHGVVSSDELPLPGRLHWHSSLHWSGNWTGESNAARAVLEQLYSAGELIIHHKSGSRKYYDLADNHLPAALLDAPDPCPDESAYLKWRILRRIGAVGLLWNRASDAWLHISGLKSALRNELFAELIAENRITELTVVGIKDKLYCRSEDQPLIEKVLQNPQFKPRCELIAPLDNFIWDRKLIMAIFGFEYTWEIYTPVTKRKYGHYVLPLLYGENLIGRAEIIANREKETLILKHIWYEDGIRLTKKLRTALHQCIKRFAKFNLCRTIDDPGGFLNTDI